MNDICYMYVNDISIIYIIIYMIYIIYILSYVSYILHIYHTKCQPYIYNPSFLQFLIDENIPL